MNDIKEDIKSELSQLNELLSMILEETDENDLKIAEIRLRNVVKLAGEMKDRERFAYYATEALEYGFEPVRLG